MMVTNLQLPLTTSKWQKPSLHTDPLPKASWQKPGFAFGFLFPGMF